MTTSALAQILAHQGGWDEVLFVAGPVLVFGGLLYIARRRALAEVDARAKSDRS